MKAEADKLEINKLVYVATSLNNLKTTGDDLVVDKLKTAAPIDLKRLSDAVNRKILKTQYLTS